MCMCEKREIKRVTVSACMHLWDRKYVHVSERERERERERENEKVCVSLRERERETILTGWKREK